MRVFLTLGFLLMLFIPLQTAAQLDQHRWEDRVLLVIAENDKKEAYKNQIKLLNQQKAELADRNLVTYQLLSNGQSSCQGEIMEPIKAERIIHAYNKEANPFLLILIGKDGGVKLRSKSVVPSEDLFALIDSMPMRRAEMRRKKGHKQ